MRESSTIHRRIVTRIHNVPSDISIFLQSSFQTSVKLILALSLLTFTRDRPRSIICAPIRVCLRTFIVRRSFFIVCWEVIVSSSQAWLYLSTILYYIHGSINFFETKSLKFTLELQVEILMKKQQNEIAIRWTNGANANRLDDSTQGEWTMSLKKVKW